MVRVRVPAPRGPDSQHPARPCPSCLLLSLSRAMLFLVPAPGPPVLCHVPCTPRPLLLAQNDYTITNPRLPWAKTGEEAQLRAASWTTSHLPQGTLLFSAHGLAPLGPCYTTETD